MASNTAATSVKRKNKHEKAGRRRKNKLAKKSTASRTELFAALGEPGKPAPKKELTRFGGDSIDRVHAFDPRQRSDHLLQLIQVPHQRVERVHRAPVIRRPAVGLA